MTTEPVDNTALFEVATIVLNESYGYQSGTARWLLLNPNGERRWEFADLAARNNAVRTARRILEHLNLKPTEGT